MTIIREELHKEYILRKAIRQAVGVVQERKKKEKKSYLYEEHKLRKIIRKLLVETEIPEPEDSPQQSTGINVLEDLLKKIIPIIEVDYKKLTTDIQQRESFRAHIIQAVENTLAPARVTDKAFLKEQDDITVNIEDDPEEFIDVRGETKVEEPSEEEEYGIKGKDETGRDMSFSTFKRIEANIVDSWEILYSDNDKELFYDYLITNLKLYFDKFEDELKATLPEPTTPEYEEEIGEEVPEEASEEELDLSI